MENKKNIEPLLSRLCEENTLLGLKEAFSGICRHYSLDQFSFAQFHYSKKLLSFELISDSYPSSWSKHYNKSQYYLNDPRLKDFGKIHSPVIWDLEKNINELSPIQQRIFREAGDFNIRHGITIPFYVEKGTQDFLTVLNIKKISPEALRIITMVASIYFEKKNLFESKDLISKLTPREYGVLKLKSEGLSTKLTADQLQISENTVTFHLLNIRKKLNTNSIDHTMFKFGAATAGNYPPNHREALG